MVRRLLLLNGIATVFAVGHHSAHWIVTAMFGWTDRYRVTTVPNYDRLGSWEFYALRLADQWWFVAVPFFLFISGYFAASLSGRTSGTLPWSVVISRIKRLVPAYVVWSTVAFVAGRLTGQTLTAREVVYKLLTGGATAPYYYVPLILTLYVLSPWLVPVARRHPRKLLLITGGLQLFVAAARTLMMVPSGSSSAANPFLAVLANSFLAAHSFWFVLGIVASLNLSDIKLRLRRARLALPFVVVLAHLFALLEWEMLRRSAGRAWLSSGTTVGDNLLALAVLLAFLAFDDVKVPWSEWLERLGEKSYGVYLIHVLVLEVGAKIIYHIAPALLGHTVLFGIVLIAAGVAVPLLLMRMVQASPLKRYYVLAFG